MPLTSHTHGENYGVEVDHEGKPHAVPVPWDDGTDDGRRIRLAAYLFAQVLTDVVPQSPGLDVSLRYVTIAALNAIHARYTGL